MIKKMTFLEKTKMRVYYGILLILVGAITLTIALYFSMRMDDAISHYTEFNSGVFSGLGGGLIGAGIATFYRHRKRLKDPVKFREAEIEENDERNIYLTQKALSVSWIVYVTILYFTMIVSAFFDSNVSIVLSICGIVAVVIYLIVYYILKKKY